MGAESTRLPSRAQIPAPPTGLGQELDAALELVHSEFEKLQDRWEVFESSSARDEGSGEGGSP